MNKIKLTTELETEIRKDFEEFLKKLKIDKTDVNYHYSLKNNAPKEKALLLFTPTAYLKIKELVNITDKEIGWYGNAVRIDAKTYRVTDVFLYPQTVTATTVTTNDHEMSEWMNKLPDEVFSNMRFHGHSHVNMGVSPSGVDTNFYNELLQNLGDNDFYIFSIFNKKDNIHLEIYDMASNTHYDDKDIDYDIEDNNTFIYDWVTANVDTFVTVIKPAVPTTHYGTNSSYGYGYSGYYPEQSEQTDLDRYLDEMQSKGQINTCGNTTTVVRDGRTYHIDNAQEPSKPKGKRGRPKNGSDKAK